MTFIVIDFYFHIYILFHLNNLLWDLLYFLDAQNKNS